MRAWYRVIALLWAGSVLGVSVVATPAKFLAESLDRPTALDVGRATFRVFGFVELVFVGALLLLVIAQRTELTRLAKAGVAAVAVILAVQLLVLVPVLNERVELVQRGLPLPDAPVHTMYGVLEFLKLAALAAIGCGRPVLARSPNIAHEPDQNLTISSSTVGPRSHRKQVADGDLLIEDLAELDITGPSGAVYSAVSEQLIMNVVTLQPGEAIGAHVEDEVDVLITTISGRGFLEVDGVSQKLASDVVAIVPRGTARSIHSTSRLVYYSTHVRRSPS